MSLHLAEVAQAVAPGAHGVLLMDRAGWHCTKDLAVPDNLTLVLLPARAPELNPVENIWQFLRDNWLSSRVFASYRDIVDHCCDAWNRLIDQPWLIMSIGFRDWAHRVLSAPVGITRLVRGGLVWCGGRLFCPASGVHSALRSANRAHRAASIPALGRIQAWL